MEGRKAAVLQSPSFTLLFAAKFRKKKSNSLRPYEKRKHVSVEYEDMSINMLMSVHEHVQVPA